MTISPGTRLGPYEIVAPIGAGGMGEVWRAKDTRLEREVAIKVLPPGLAEDAQFLKRFEREAKTISQLSHPHVCALYDVGEESTEEGSTVHFLVMELLEGESLAERIEKGRLPLNEVLRYGREIASALDAAHRRGITHRDLKPGNIMLTKSGAKLLDFGLAKTASEGRAPVDGLTNLPTAVKALTQEGTILGTFQYMAPEQLEGLAADARTDIFALGAVLYEMATGQRAFESETKTSLIAAIVSSQPKPISSVVAMSPPSLDHVVRRCLEKDPDDRWQSAHDVAGQLQWISEAGSQAGVATPISVRRKTRERLAWGAAAILAITTVVVSVLWLRTPQVQSHSFRLTIPTSTASYQRAGQGIISPDGARVIFTAMNPEGKWSLWVRDLDSFDARPIDGTKPGRIGFWSPDGRSYAYWSGGNLMSIDLDGGSPQTIAPASWLQGGDWNKDGVIIFGVGESGIMRVQATGGTPTEITHLDPKHFERTDVYPQFLPDGKHFLFVATTFDPNQKNQTHRLYVGSLDSSKTKFITNVTSATSYVEPGYLLYVRNGTLIAVPFDDKKLEVTGEPIRIVDDVGNFLPLATANFSVSKGGTIVYQPPARSDRVVRLNEKGNEIAQIGKVGSFGQLRVSPDGSRVAVAVHNPKIGTTDLWQYGLERDTSRRITSDPRDESNPIWTPDGKRMIYMAALKGWPDIYQIDLDGSDGTTPLLLEKGLQFPNDISPDGRYLIYQSFTGLLTRNVDLWILPLQKDAKPHRFTSTPFHEGQARFSPDGKWVAYASDESGQTQIYVKPFPGPGQAIQISTDEGTDPAWSRDGKNLYYSWRNRMSVVKLGDPADFSNPKPETLFKTKGSIRAFDVAPDGEFVAVLRDESKLPPNRVIVNWAGESKK